MVAASRAAALIQLVPVCASYEGRSRGLKIRLRVLPAGRMKGMRHRWMRCEPVARSRTRCTADGHRRNRRIGRIPFMRPATPRALTRLFQPSRPVCSSRKAAMRFLKSPLGFHIPSLLLFRRFQGASSSFVKAHGLYFWGRVRPSAVVLRGPTGPANEALYRKEAGTMKLKILLRQERPYPP